MWSAPGLFPKAGLNVQPPLLAHSSTPLAAKAGIALTAIVAAMSAATNSAKTMRLNALPATDVSCCCCCCPIIFTSFV